jgi:hypothetical protein
MRPDFSQACFKVVRAYFDPPDPRMMEYRGIRSGRGALSHQGVRIKLPEKGAFPVYKRGAYPHVLQLDDSGVQIYAPSLSFEAWMEQSGQLHQSAEGVDQLFGQATPSCVIILAVTVIGDLVISWGQRQWFAIFSWDKVAEACELSPSSGMKLRDQDCDYVEAARLVFAKPEAWMAFVKQSANRREVDLPVCKIRWKLDVMIFFGRSLLDVEVDVVRKDDWVVDAAYHKGYKKAGRYSRLAETYLYGVYIFSLKREKHEVTSETSLRGSMKWPATIPDQGFATLNHHIQGLFPATLWGCDIWVTPGPGHRPPSD